MRFSNRERTAVGLASVVPTVDFTKIKRRGEGVRTRTVGCEVGASKHF